MEGNGRLDGESVDASRGATSPTVSSASLRYRKYSFAATSDDSAGQTGGLRLERIATIATQKTHDPTESVRSRLVGRSLLPFSQARP